MEDGAAYGDAAADESAPRSSARLVIQQISRQEDLYQFTLDHPYHGVDPGILPSD